MGKPFTFEVGQRVRVTQKVFGVDGCIGTVIDRGRDAIKHDPWYEVEITPTFFADELEEIDTEETEVETDDLDYGSVLPTGTTGTGKQTYD